METSNWKQNNKDRVRTLSKALKRGKENDIFRQLEGPK